MALSIKDVTEERAEILGEIEGQTLLTTLADTAERFADRPALTWKEEAGWRTTTWHDYRQLVLDAAEGMRSLGVQPGEFALIMSRNRPEAVIAEMATLHARGVPVHLYNTLPPEQIEYLANHCEATTAFLEDASQLLKFTAIQGRLPRLSRLVILGAAESNDRTLGWQDVLARGRRMREQGSAWAEAASHEVRPDDLATVIYTSGTTGLPKGVMDTHRAVLYFLKAWHRRVPPPKGNRQISHLPLAHAAGRTLDVWAPLVTGHTTFFCPDIQLIASYLVEVRPTDFTTVPRIWEKLSAGLMAGVAAIADPTSKSTLESAIEVGRKVVRLEQRHERVPSELAAEHERGEPIRRSLLARVGLDACVQAASGAAPIDPAIIELFQALGISMAEAWGMTELTCVATCSTPEDTRNGKVGCASPGVEISLAPDGEVLVRGPLVMKGYYKDREKTAETIDAAGWLHTGDIGSFDSDGYLAIVDRKKELIITSGGKNISPANIEHFLIKHSLIGQALAIGDRRNYITALLVLDPMTAPVWAKQHGIQSASLGDLQSNPDVLAEVQRAVDAANEHLARVEQVKRFRLLAEQWTPETGELTPTLKLKRRVVLERNAGAIEAMYADSRNA